MKIVVLITVGVCAAAFAALAWVAALRRRGDRFGPALRVWLGRGMGVEELARRLGVKSGELRKLRPAYRKVSIPKRNGGRRELCVPDGETKAMQRRILRRLLGRLRVHDAATGFVRGRSIVDNALPHVAREVVVKMDVTDFFTNTSASRVDRYFRRIGWGREAAALLVKLTAWDGGLPQGAPTSPPLSNLVNYRLDARLSGYAKALGGVYTRYADDMTVSLSNGDRDLVRNLIRKVRRLCKAHGYEVHVRGKLRVLRRHQRQKVTGLVVNDGVRLPRERRRWLRAVRHRMDNGGGATISPAALAGWEGLARMVEKQTGRAK